MSTLLLILACFAGTFAFAFGLAGIIGLLDFEPPKDTQGTFPFWVDQILAGGLGAMMRDIARNWSARPAERRLLYIGAAYGALCILFLILRSGFS